jgi:hypothetical protein
MKLSDVQVGARYHAKVSGRLQVVRVTELRQATRWSSHARAKTLILAVNEATGRMIPIRSPLRLRPLPGKGCEFWNQPFGAAIGFDEIASIQDAFEFFRRGRELTIASR